MKMSLVAHACNISTLKREQNVQGQPGPHSKNLYWKEDLIILVLRTWMWDTLVRFHTFH